MCSANTLNELQQRYQDRVTFLVIYVREAHPDPNAPLKRVDACRDMCDVVPVDPTVLIDDVDDSTERAYDAWPNRLYLIGRDGRVVYKSDHGPDGYRLDELEAAIDGLE